MNIFLWVKRILGCIILVTLLGLYWNHPKQQLTASELLLSLEKRSFQYFIDYQYPGTGLVADNSQWPIASTSATGFGLSALVIGAERGWIARREAEKRAVTVLTTCINLISKRSLRSSFCGFLYHFMDGRTGMRFQTTGFKSEVSIVDMAILIAGALTSGEYFGGQVRDAAEKLYELVQWDKFLDADLNLFFGAWTPEQGFSAWHWDYYSDEIILIVLLAIGSPTYPVNRKTFYSWQRKFAVVNGKTFIRSWFGSLFTYQLAELWFNMQGFVDEEGVNWWENSRAASLADRDLCIKYAEEFPSYGTNSWGVTPCFDPRSPGHYGGTLSIMTRGEQATCHYGTIAPSGAAGSMVFTPQYAQEALLHYYRDIPRLWGRYGFKSSFNLTYHWVAPIYYGIEQGITLLGIDDYQYGTIPRLFNKSPFVKEALYEAGFRRGIGYLSPYFSPR